jgi:3-methyladenine DNA glycosylase AlkC
MTEEHHAITLDYERTVAELREASIRLTVELEKLVDECDRLRVENNNLILSEQHNRESGKLLLQTIDILRSENERLKIALQTGEQ